MGINWRDPSCMISRYFSVHEAIFLPKLHRLATEADGLTPQVKNNLLELFDVMDDVRRYLGTPILVCDAYRPQAYNALVNGALGSQHLCGKAVDWVAAHMGCDDVRERMVHKLSEWGLRMEKKPGAPWIHTDTKDVVDESHRYFVP